MADEFYLSVDVEADGPIPGPHSLLSLGAAAFDKRGTLLGTFSANLQQLPGSSMHPETAEFWKAHPDALAVTRVDPEDPKAAMERFEAWLQAFPGTPVFVGWPAGFDFTFVYWYLRRFLDRSPLSFSALDIKSYAMALTGLDYVDVLKRKLPERWFGKPREGHIALNDALMQGEMFGRMLVERTDQPGLRGAILGCYGDVESGVSFDYREGMLRIDLVLPDLRARRSIAIERDEIVAFAKVLGRVASRRDSTETVELPSVLRLELARTERAVGARFRFFEQGGANGVIETRFDVEPKTLGTCAGALRDACAGDDRSTDLPWI